MYSDRYFRDGGTVNLLLLKSFLLNYIDVISGYIRGMYSVKYGCDHTDGRLSFYLSDIIDMVSLVIDIMGYPTHCVPVFKNVTTP